MDTRLRFQFVCIYVIKLFVRTVCQYLYKKTA